MLSNGLNTLTFKRKFSKTNFLKVKPNVMSELDKLMEKTNTFNKNLHDLQNITERHTLLLDKDKLVRLKIEEWAKLEEFVGKYVKYLKPADREKLFNLFQDGEKMEALLKDKLDKLNISSGSDILDMQKSLKLSELTYTSKYRIFDQAIDLFKPALNNRPSIEKDAFYAVLAKRNQEKASFLDFKNKHLESLKAKLDIASKGDKSQTSGGKSSTQVKETFNSSLSESKSSIAENSSSIAENSSSIAENSSSIAENSSSIAESTSIPGKEAISNEVLTVIQELLNYFG